MLAPLPAIVHVPDDTVALPTTPVLPTSRLAHPVGIADCARTKLALTANAHTNPTADKAPPRICLVVKMPLPVICRALLEPSARHVSAGRTDVSPSHTPQLFVISQADCAGKSAATWTDSTKIQHLPRFSPVELGLKVGRNGFRPEQNYTNRGWAQEIITTS